jgi:prepilin-type N-terminal cleavage/methylation domain-containing protein
MMNAPRNRLASNRLAQRAHGFTLIEVVLVMALLAIVLGITYEILVDCLAAEQKIERLTLPEKAGDGVLSLMRTDLSGTIYRNLGRRIFLVTDSGAPPEARDEIRFLSTVEPTPVDEGDAAGLSAFRTITGVAYFLRPSQLPENVTAYTLFRKEIVNFDPLSPLESPGVNYEVYDKVKSLSFECFDGWEWSAAWDSETRIQVEEQALLESTPTNEGIARVSDPQSDPLAAAAPGVNPNAAGTPEMLPPAAVPVAVRIELSIYSGVGNKIDRDPSGNPVVKTFTTVVPILTAQRIPIEIEENLGMDGAMAGGGSEGAGGPEGLNFSGTVQGASDKAAGPKGARGGRGPRPGGAPGAGGTGRQRQPLPPGMVPPGGAGPRGARAGGPGAKR